MTIRLSSPKAQCVYAKGKGTQPETLILRAVRDYLRQFGWMVIRHQQGLGSHPGLADLQATRGGRVVMIECKTPKGKLSAAQEAFRRDWEAAGGEYIVARCVEDAIAMSGERVLV